MRSQFVWPDAREDHATRRRRVAFFTPWPPDRSDLAAYNARLLPELAKHADVDVIVDGSAERYERSGHDGLNLISRRSFVAWARALRRYDVAVYCLGGDAACDAWIREELRARPGVVAIHGAVATPESCALVLVVESERDAATVRRVSELPPVQVIPRAITETSGDSRRPWRDVRMVVSFDALAGNPHAGALVESFALVAVRRPASQLILAGDADNDELDHWRDRIRALGLADRIQLPGRLPDARYEELLAHASVAVQVAPGAGAAATAADALSRGLPAIVADTGWLAEVPRDAVVHVPPAATAEQLAVEIERLLGDEQQAASVSRAALTYTAATTHRAIARRWARELLAPEPPPAEPPEALRPAELTIVIGAYNRIDRVLLVLQSLAKQTRRDFAVVIADQGSTDGTSEEIARLANTPRWRGRLVRVDTADGPAGVGLPRNRAAIHAAPGSTLLLMLDADVLLVPHGIERLLLAHAAHPEAAILCQFDWLAPTPLLDVERLLRRGAWEALAALAPSGGYRHVAGTMVGCDPRPRERFRPAAVAIEEPLEAWLVLGALHAIPREVFARTGGFDESMGQYGYEDIEHGVRMRQLGVPMVLISDCAGLHIWHPKPDWEALSILNQQNLDYMLRKHGPEAAKDDAADWSVWWHYHADRRGRVVRSAGRLWAVDRSDRTRLALPSVEWVARLGQRLDSVTDLDARGLDRLRDEGVARDLALDRRS